MQKIFITIFSLSLVAFISSCGPKEAKTLEEKKALLSEKKQTLRSLTQEVSLLEEEINKMDPELRESVRQAPVSTTEVKTSQFQHFVQVQGQVEANKNILVSPLVGGRVTRINVREGQSVGAGTVLAQIDDAVMKASIEEIKTSLDLAKIMFEKQKNLWEQEIGTEVQYLTAKNQVESLERRLKTMEEQLEMNRIKSPIAGTVDEIMPKVGETVSPGFPAFRIVNPSDLSLKAQMSEAYIPYIKKGDLVKVKFPALEKEIEARVSTVGQFIDPNDRTFPVEVKLPNNPLFKANMFGSLSINDQTRENAVTVPVNLVQQSEEGSFVFVAKEENGKWKAIRTDIETGLSYEGQVEVISGLQAGDQLISMGYKNLSDGQEIILNQTQSLAGN